MSRIDVQTLVLAFESRIAALEKNPPDKIPTSVVLNLLDKAIENTIKEHFVEMVYKDIQQSIKKELKNSYSEFVSMTVNNILGNPIFRDEIENKFKRSIVKGIDKLEYCTHDD